MKADNRILIKLLPALALLACVGCIAQTGTPDDQSSSSAEALSTGVPEGKVQPAAPAENEHALVRDNALRKGLPNEGALTAPGYDPGAPVSGDGDDPDPHPWEPHATGIAVH